MYSVRKRDGRWIVSVSNSIISFECYADGAVVAAQRAAAVLRECGDRRSHAERLPMGQGWSH